MTFHRKTLAIAAFLMAVGFATTLSLQVNALYSKSYLNNNLENGLQTAVDWDSNMSKNDSCKYITNFARKRTDGKNVDDLRTNYINVGSHGLQPASYRIDTWLSARNTPNIVNPVTVNYGTTGLNIQVNNVSFLCGTLVKPGVGTSCSGLSTNSIYNDNRWMTTNNVDQHPNDMGNNCLQPAKTRIHTKITSVSVATTGSFDGTVSWTGGSVMNIDRDDNSRYWFAQPVPMKFNFKKPVTSDGTIVLVLHVKIISTYNTGVSRCTNGNGGTITVGGPNDYDSCGTQDDTLRLHLHVKNSWDITPAISVSQTSRSQGQTYTVAGNATNNGSTASNGTDWRIMRVIYAPNDTIPTKAAGETDSNTPCSVYTREQSCAAFKTGTRNLQASGNPIELSRESGIPVTQPAGTRICYATWVNDPTPANSPKWRYSQLKCLVVVYNYDLVPTVSVNPDSVEGETTPYSVTSNVNNTSSSTSASIKWYTTRLVYGPGKQPSTESGDADEGPCAFFDDADKCNDSPPFQQTTRTFSPGETTKTWPDTPGVDSAIGTSICYVSSVSRPTEGANPVWRHSKLACVMIAKKPKVQIWGGDLKVYGDITGSMSSVGGNTHYGSWGEYGVFANCSTSGFASGSGLSGGTTDGLESDYEQLTFANSNLATSATRGNCSNKNGTYGYFGLSALPALGPQFSSTRPTPLGTKVNLGTLQSGNYQRRGNLTIERSDIPSGRSIIINATGTVTIDDDIKYQGANGNRFTSIDQIPQVVIVAPNIVIKNDAGWIDAWLLARTDDQTGSINTCGDVSVTAPLTSDQCDNPLTINGPVETDKLYLRRTAGSDDEDSMDDPAETFDLRADAYLWAYRQANVTGQAETVYTTEVPPRF